MQKTTAETMKKTNTTTITISLDLWFNDDCESSLPDKTHTGTIQIPAGMDDSAVGQLVDEYSIGIAKAHGYSTENFNWQWDYIPNA